MKDGHKKILIVVVSFCMVNNNAAMQHHTLSSGHNTTRVVNFRTASRDTITRQQIPESLR